MALKIGEVLKACFELALFSVSSRLHTSILGQLAQLIVSEGIPADIVKNALIHLFAQDQLVGLSARSHMFKERCVYLLTVVRKPMLLKSIIVDLLNVQSNLMNETMFLAKYSSILLVCFKHSFQPMKQYTVVEDSPRGRYKKVRDTERVQM